MHPIVTGTKSGLPATSFGIAGVTKTFSYVANEQKIYLSLGVSGC
jgi:hypothetical protein